MPQVMPRKQDPQTDGTTERVNQEIEAYLSIYCASHPEEWPQALHTLEFTHNNRRHADRPAHVVKDYTNKAKTDMFLPLSES